MRRSCSDSSLTASQLIEFSEATGMRQHQKQDRFNDGNNGQVISDIPSKLERRRRMALFLQLGSASGPIGAATQPFIALFLLGYLGLLISNFPYIVPPSLTIWQAAAASATHVFMLMGTLVMLPIIFGYTIFVYWIFSGKLREGEGYH
jgi:hypothetical protein